MQIVGSLVLFALATGVETPAPHMPPGGELVGFYTGTLPCADCAGIRTELTLLARTYWLKETRLGGLADGATLESTGDWVSGSGPERTSGRVLHFTDAGTGDRRAFLQASDDELQAADRDGRAIHSAESRTLRRQTVKEEPVPHRAPSERYLLAFYTGTLPCPDCDGVRLELSLFDGPGAAGGRSYWLKETRFGHPDGERTAESSGQWRSDRRTAYVKDGNDRIVGAREVKAFELARNEEQWILHEAGPDELTLVSRNGRTIPGDPKLVRRVAAIPGAAWSDAIGCTTLSRGGIDSAGGSLRCGATVIAYDMGGNAGDWCGDAITADLSSVGHLPMKMCVGREGSITVSLPEEVANLYVGSPTAEDTMVLLHVARHLAETRRAYQAWLDRATHKRPRRVRR